MQSRVMEKLGEGEGHSVKAFEEVVSGQASFDVARMFLATLMLVTSSLRVLFLPVCVTKMSSTISREIRPICMLQQANERNLDIDYNSTTGKLALTAIAAPRDNIVVPPFGPRVEP